MKRAWILLALLGAPVSAAAQLPMATFENYWPEEWLDRFDEADNAVRFSSGSITGATMYLAEDVKVTRSLTETLTFRYRHHFESGLIERVKSESDAWRGQYGLFEMESRVAAAWFLSGLALPSYDKRVTGLGVALTYRQSARSFAKISLLHALFARNVQSYYDNAEYGRRYAVPATYVHFETMRELTQALSLSAEAQWFRQAYAYYGTAGYGIVDEVNLLWRAKLAWKTEGFGTVRARFEGEDGYTYEELSCDGRLGRFHLRPSAGYGFWRERQSDFFTDTFRHWNVYTDTLLQVGDGVEMGMGYGREQPLSGWLPRFRSALPIQRLYTWIDEPFYLNHIRLLLEWNMRPDLMVFIWFTIEDQDFKLANIAWWGRLLRVQAQFRF